MWRHIFGNTEVWGTPQGVTVTRDGVVVVNMESNEVARIVIDAVRQTEQREAQERATKAMERLADALEKQSGKEQGE
jgi:hypothetical protein